MTRLSVKTTKQVRVRWGDRSHDRAGLNKRVESGQTCEEGGVFFGGAAYSRVCPGHKNSFVVVFVFVLALIASPIAVVAVLVIVL